MRLVPVVTKLLIISHILSINLRCMSLDQDTVINKMRFRKQDLDSYLQANRKLIVFKFCSMMFDYVFSNIERGRLLSKKLITLIALTLESKMK